MEAAVVADDDDGLQRYLCRLDVRRRNEIKRPNLRVKRCLDQGVADKWMSRGDSGRGLCGNEQVGAGRDLGEH
jgi:hypothetical protein